MTKRKDPKDCLPAWRPSGYKEKYCEDIINYFQTCQAEILIDVKFFMPNKNATISTILNPLNQEETVDVWNVKEIAQKLVMNKFPTFIRYWLKIWVNEDTMLAREKKYPKFLGARRVCKSIQEAILVENWLQWTYNPQFAMFMLKNNHWYKDRQDVWLWSQDGWPLVITFKE